MASALRLLAGSGRWCGGDLRRHCRVERMITRRPAFAHVGAARPAVAVFSARFSVESDVHKAAQDDLRDRIFTMEQAAIGLPFMYDSEFVHGLMDHVNRPGAARDFSKDPATGDLVYRYVVPEHVCAVEGLSSFTNGALPLSALLAVFDNVSSWSLIGSDRWNRPGVSLGLSVRRISPEPVHPGAMLDFRTRLGKVGERVGFCDADIVDAQTGALVAVAQHTKFMDMGPVWKAVVPHVLATKQRRDGLLAAVRWLEARRRAAASSSPAPPAADTAATAFADLLRVQFAAPPAPREGRTAGGVVTEPIVCSAAHYNPPGTVHGGCLAMFLEQMAWAALGEAGRQGPHSLQHLQISYPRAARRTLRGTAKLLHPLPDDGRGDSNDEQAGGRPSASIAVGAAATGGRQSQEAVVSAELSEQDSTRSRWQMACKGTFQFLQQ